MQHWINGSPNSEGLFFVLMHDQGGYEFVEVAKVSYAPKAFANETMEDAIARETDKLIKSIQIGEGYKLKERKVLWIEIPFLNNVKKEISQVWNIDGYMPIEQPKI